MAENSFRFTRQHLWLNDSGDRTYFAGITDHAQQALGDIVFIEAPEAGTEIKAGVACGVIESVKTASDLIAPVNGKVLEVNAELQDSPEQVNDHPYQAWIFRIAAEDAGQLAQLMNESDYLTFLNEN